MTNEWFARSETVFAVASYGVDVHAFDDQRDLLYFFEKPWKYEELFVSYTQQEEETI